MLHRPLGLLSRYGWCLLAFLFIASWAHALDVDVSTAPYNVDPAVMTPDQITTGLQQALDDVGAVGGTVTIPPNLSTYQLSGPLYLWSVNNPVTVKGGGYGTNICARPQIGPTIPFILGMKKDYGMTAALYPALTGVYDSSVTTPKYGLCTYDAASGVRASGYFPVSSLAYGSNKERTIAGTYYPTGCALPSHLYLETAWTLDLCVRNDDATPMVGTICGAGAGGPNGNITDPRTIWTVETDGTTTWFKFKTQGKTDPTNLTTESLTIATSPLTQGVHRISVQLDFVAGTCRAWYSKDNPSLSLCPTGQLNLAADSRRFMNLEYGSFRLGKMAASCYDGAPAKGDSSPAKWTFCGLRMNWDAVYNPASSPQTLVSNGTLNDNVRYFDADNGAGSRDKTLTRLLLDTQPSAGAHKMVVAYQDGRNMRNNDGYTSTGFWLPNRALQPMTGKITLADIYMAITGYYDGANFAIAEASSAELHNVNGASWPLHGITTFDCPIARALTVITANIASNDTALFAQSTQLNVRASGMGACGSIFRLVGCWGECNSIMWGESQSLERAACIYAGPASMPMNGPLKMYGFCNDNEGGTPTLFKFFYLEPSLAAGPGGNVFEIYAYANGGQVDPNGSFLELADPPLVGGGVPKAFVTVNIAAINAAMNCFAKVHSSNWYGSLYDCSRNWPLSWGYLNVDNGITCHMKTFSQDANSIPSNANWHWYAGCDVVQCPTPAAQAGAVTEYRCTGSGVGPAATWTTDTLQ